MNKIYKLHFKGLGKVFLLASTIFLFSGIENANAQVEIRCTSTSNANLNHSHGINIINGVISYKPGRPYCYDCGTSRDCCEDTVESVYGTPSVYAAALSVNFCNSWALFINGQQVSNMDQLLQKIPSKDKGTFRTKVIESLNTMELQKIYDPNLLRN